jgi:hypothetical protein
LLHARKRTVDALEEVNVSHLGTAVEAKDGCPTLLRKGRVAAIVPEPLRDQRGGLVSILQGQEAEDQKAVPCVESVEGAGDGDHDEMQRMGARE